MVKNQRHVLPSLLVLLLHPHQCLLLLSFVVRRATNHNPAHVNSINAWAATRCNIATKIVNERIGKEEATNKNAND